MTFQQINLIRPNPTINYDGVTINSGTLLRPYHINILFHCILLTIHPKVEGKSAVCITKFKLTQNK